MTVDCLGEERDGRGENGDCAALGLRHESFGDIDEEGLHFRHDGLRLQFSEMRRGMVGARVA